MYLNLIREDLSPPPRVSVVFGLSFPSNSGSLLFWQLLRLLFLEEVLRFVRSGNRHMLGRKTEIVFPSLAAQIVENTSTMYEDIYSVSQKVKLDMIGFSSSCLVPLLEPDRKEMRLLHFGKKHWKKILSLEH
jgi:hypothetical protein